MGRPFEVRAGVLTGCITPEPVLRLPEEIRVIGELAFRGMTGIREIFIPEGVEVIEYKAFHDCADLETVHFPDSLRHIHDGAFEGCARLRAPVFPRDLRMIGREAFRGCAFIHSIAIPHSVEILGFGAFRGCGLEQVEMENRDFTHFYDVEVLFLHGRCPCWHKALKQNADGSLGCGCARSRDYAPYTRDSVRAWTESGDEYYSYFQHLRSVGLYNPYPSMEETWTVIRCGKLEDALRGTVLYTPTRLEICTTAGVIPGGFFQGWQGLKEVRIWDGVKEIGDSSFAGCENLTEVLIPNTVTRIGENAFANCPRLRTVHIFPPVPGGGLREIDPGAFFGCTVLSDIRLPRTVRRLGKDAFKRCGLLESAILPTELEDLELTQVFTTDEDGLLVTEVYFGDADEFPIL